MARRAPGGFLLAVALLASAAATQAAVSVALFPPVVEETVRPGHAVKGTISYTNRSDEPVQVAVSVVDFDVGQNNEVIEQPPGTQPTSLSPYLRVSPSSVRVAPGQEIYFRYAVGSPEEFTHLRGMVYFVTQPDRPAEAGPQVLFVARLGIPFYVESSRARAAELRVDDLSWTRAEAEQVTLQLDVVNEGERIFRPPGLVEVRSEDGRFRKNFPFNAGQEPVLPGHARRFERSFGPVPEGDLTVRLHLNTSPSRRYRSPPQTVTGPAGSPL
jgi:P pilus assembly chaperone PapD